MTVPGTTRCPDPSCRAVLVKRRQRYGGRQEFYGCSEWPRCKETLPISERERMLLAGEAQLPGFETEEA